MPSDTFVGTVPGSVPIEEKVFATKGYLYSERRPAPTLKECGYTVPDGFALEPATANNKDTIASMLKFRNTPVASISWHHQHKAMAFHLYTSEILEYETMRDALEDLILRTLLHRLKGEI